MIIFFGLSAALTRHRARALRGGTEQRLRFPDGDTTSIPNSPILGKFHIYGRLYWYIFLFLPHPLRCNRINILFG
jgi:hypothetical protein